MHGNSSQFWRLTFLSLSDRDRCEPEVSLRSARHVPTGEPVELAEQGWGSRNAEAPPPLHGGEGTGWTRVTVTSGLEQRMVIAYLLEQTPAGLTKP